VAELRDVKVSWVSVSSHKRTARARARRRFQTPSGYIRNDRSKSSCLHSNWLGSGLLLVLAAACEVDSWGQCYSPKNDQYELEFQTQTTILI